MPDPVFSAHFMRKYVGGVPIADDKLVGCCSDVVSGLRYFFADGKAYTDVYFWFSGLATDVSEYEETYAFFCVVWIPSLRRITTGYHVMFSEDEYYDFEKCYE